MDSLTHRLTAFAYGLGFDAVGVAELGEPATRAAFDAWLDRGQHAEMHYLDGVGAELRRDTRRPHPEATHALVLAASYGGRAPSGPVARYARGDDYHEVLRERVRELHHWLERELGHPVNARPYVDSGPILERDLAQRAGFLSVLFPEDRPATIDAYQGSYDAVQPAADWGPLYWTAIASNAPLPAHRPRTAFVGDALLSRMGAEVAANVRATRDFRLGAALLWPLRALKRFLRQQS
jgi:hypothetical protein